MRSIVQLVLGALALLVGVRLWALLAGRRRGVYYLSGPRQVRLLFWPLVGLVASLPFALGVLRRADDLPPALLVAGLGAAAALLSLSVPALVLHARYRAHDAATAVEFDARADVLVVHRPDRPAVRVRPGDVRTVTHLLPQTSRAFWGAYEALRLDFFPTSNQAPLTLTSAVLDLAPVVRWLHNRGVPTVRQRRWLAWV